jgi:hypothetical protein
LLGSPFGRWVQCRVEVDYTAPIVREDQEDE